MTGKTKRQLWVSVPIKTDVNILIETELTDGELQKELDSVKGNFLLLESKFEVLDTCTADFEEFDDTSYTEIVDNDNNQLAYYKGSNAEI